MRLTKALFEPITLRHVDIRNRIVMPSMTTRLADPEGFVTPEFIQYYLTRAQGETGLITVEMASPEPAGRHRAGELGISHDRFIPGLQDLTTQLKQAGATTSIQLGHAGGHTRQDITGFPPVAPSALPHKVHEVDTRTVMPQALSLEGIRELVRAFAAAAERAKLAGFDVIELHGAHGYLIAQFLSPLDNQRSDEYGGSLQHRARFALEVVQACRERLGDFPIIFRLSADEYAPGGMRLDQATQVSCWLVEAGVDAIHVTAACYRSQPSAAVMIPPMAYPEGVFLHLAGAVKEVVEVPVIAVGRLHDPILAARVVAEGQADMIALGRQLLADPEWPRKARQGRIEAIRPCISCNTCVDGMRDGSQLHCLVNPQVGRETQYRLTPTERPLSVLVVGGGPAGMEAARILAARGHRVMLCERREHLGGQLLLAARTPMFQNVETRAEVLLKIVEFQTRQLETAGVEVSLAQAVTSEFVAAVRPDLVVLATGASYRLPFCWVPLLLETSWVRTRMLRTLLLKPAIKRLFYSMMRKPNARLFRHLRRSGIDLWRIGDCDHPGKTPEAIASAAELAYRL
jgi:2,4-dienoyl-CoA reductase-like NADH-dependent reductase (Old Yellow Enzyme family)